MFFVILQMVSRNTEYPCCKGTVASKRRKVCNHFQQDILRGVFCVRKDKLNTRSCTPAISVSRAFLSPDMAFSTKACNSSFVFLFIDFYLLLIRQRPGVFVTEKNCFFLCYFSICLYFFLCRGTVDTDKKAIRVTVHTGLCIYCTDLCEQ